VIVSPASIKSAWVPFEIGYFTALKRRVLPYLVHPSTDLPGYLSSLKHIATMEELSAYFSRVKNDWDSMQNNHFPSLPNVIVRYSPGLTRSRLGNFITLVTFFVENHDTQKVFMSSVSLLLDDGRRLQITNDGLTGAAIPRQVLEPGQRMDVTITRKDLDANSIRPENVVGVVAVDDIGRRFHGDPSHLQACLAELVSRA
jgi:hypothetical protein